MRGDRSHFEVGTALEEPLESGKPLVQTVFLLMTGVNCEEIDLFRNVTLRLFEMFEYGSRCKVSLESSLGILILLR